MLVLDITVLVTWFAVSLMLIAMCGGAKRHWVITLIASVIFIVLTPAVMAIGHSLLVYGK